MQVILLENIVGLGTLGSTVNVRGGYARNYLLPTGKALPATDDNVAKFESRRKDLEEKDNARKAEAETLAAKLTDVTVKIPRQARETGVLYGSVKARDVSQALEDAGYEVPAQYINIGTPIKALGEFSVNLTLHPEVTLPLPVVVEHQAG